ncbi:hypothetical protein AB9P05_19795 [Roseivirga sp. BDSF3-8]|uniref:hypothetical protein n=1 Tax=Roseivirga sp. BDSF3-8 TaxID=3241598 RepID=UPI003531D18D
MSREISLFANYHQKENTVTNYCGLMMKLIYEESSTSFQELLVTLSKSEGSIEVGPKFRQQAKKQKSIPDLVISQPAFNIFFENKLSDWFHIDQIKNHMKGFGDGSGTNILFLLCKFDDENLENRFGEEIAIAEKEGISIVPITYEDLIDAIDNTATTDFLRKYAQEFRSYLDRGKLLPAWKKLLTVVNCVGTKEEIWKSVYMCPDSGGAYSHRRARYFGTYYDKRVQMIFEIKALVVVKQHMESAEIKWNNSGSKNDEQSYIEEAKAFVSTYRSGEIQKRDLQVFLLDDKKPVNFKKDTHGGMQQSKLYFYIAKGMNNTEELAQKIDGKTWSEFRG